MPKLKPADLETLAVQMREEAELLEAGRVWMAYLHPEDDYSLCPPEMLIALAKSKDDPTRFGHPSFLRCHNIRRQRGSFFDHAN